MDWDFSQNAEVESLDKVPETLQPFYGEKDDKSGFAVKSTPETKAAIGLIGGLTGALITGRAAEKAALKKAVDLSPLSEYGEGVEEIKAGIETKLEELNARVKGGKESAANLEKVKADIRAAGQKQVDAKQKEIDGLTLQLKDLTVTNVANDAIVKHKGSKLVLPFVRERVKTTVGDDGKFRAFVTEEGSEEPKYSGVSGQPMTIDELVGEMKVSTQFGVLFESEAKRGSGQAPNASAGTRTPQKGRELSPVEKIRAGLDARRKRGE